MKSKYSHTFPKICIALLILVFSFALGIYYLPPIIGETLVPMYFSLFPERCSITTDEVVIENEKYNPSNNCQTGANVWMGTYDGKLYFYPSWCQDASVRTKYHQYISVFEGGTAVQLVKIRDSIVGIQDGMIFYWTYPADYGMDNEEICYYSIPTRKTESVLTGDADWYFSSDGVLHFGTEEIMYQVQNGIISTTSGDEESFVLSNRTYTIDGQFNETIIVTDKNGVSSDLSYIISGGKKSLISCEEGLLVHNEGQGDLLYLIRESDGDVVELFTVPCIKSTSAVNVHDGYVFISFSRYRYDELLDSTVPFENDSLSGTYRINLYDLTACKISDSIYSGLFIFDDSGIYACDDDCHIYKIDFEGNVIQTLLS